MPAYVALLRGVNMAGHGKLPMAELQAVCRKAGFTSIKTYLASGNVILRSTAAASTVKSRLENALAAHTGRRIRVFVRTAVEIAAVAHDNPFPAKPGSLVAAFFLDRPVTADALQSVQHQGSEEIRPGKREIYVYFAAGFAGSRLRIPAAKDSTARNMNTVTKLAEMVATI
jgi:uncharacterized protein (DUF1697 family)